MIIIIIIIIMIIIFRILSCYYWSLHYHSVLVPGCLFYQCPLAVNIHNAQPFGQSHQGTCWSTSLLPPAHVLEWWACVSSWPRAFIQAGSTEGLRLCCVWWSSSAPEYRFGPRIISCNSLIYPPTSPPIRKVH